MTPEERFNQQVWWILQEIRKEQFYEPEDGKDKVGFSIRTQENHTTPSPDEQRKLLNTLKGWGVLELRPRIDDLFRGNTDLLSPTTHFILTIHLPKFEETYAKYQKACDVSTYLNNYQDKVYRNLKNNKDKNMNLPEFSRLDNKTRTIAGKISSKNKAQKVIIKFDSQLSAIIANDISVKIPFSTNQYYLCKAVFGNTKKRWENDEILDKFGANIEEAKVKRQPYDAMLAVNKKVKKEAGIDDLILCENKTFRINPRYVQ